MSILRSAFCFLIATSFVIMVHRLPAPISEESATPVPEQATKPKAKQPKPREKNESEPAKSKPAPESTPRPSGVARNLDGPKPIFPPEAAQLRLTGTGKYLLQFDQNTGRVIDVLVTQSAGSPLLDDSAVAAFRQWHEDPRCAKEVTMTMNFGVTQPGAEAAR